MTERLINIFVYGDRTHVQTIGWCMYEKAGTYEGLTKFLQSRVQHDHRDAPREDLEEPIPWRNFEVMDRLTLIAGVLAGGGVVNLNENDIYCVTRIVNGEVRVDDTLDAVDVGAVPDYLHIYSTTDGFDFPQLILDDYFEAIHLLWHSKKYVSCLKLVFSAIETLGYVEYGPNGGNCFAKWLDDYCDLEKVGVTSDEERQANWCQYRECKSPVAND